MSISFAIEFFYRYIFQPNDLCKKNKNMKNTKCSSCGFINFASATDCRKCRQPLSTVPNSESDAPNNSIWQDGNQLVMNLGAELPDKCIMCNEPANGRRFPVKLTWDQKLWKTPLLVGYAVVSYKETSLEVGVCDRHYRRLDLTMFFGVLSIILGFVVFFLNFLFRRSSEQLAINSGNGFVGCDFISRLRFYFLRANKSKSGKRIFLLDSRSKPVIFDETSEMV